MNDDKITFEIKKTSNLIKRTLNTKYPSHITTTNMIILNYIDENNKNDKFTYAKDLEEFLEIRRSSISEILDGMESKKLIKRNIGNDLRTKEIILDKKGIEILEEFRENIRKFELGLHKNIDDNDLLIFFKVLKTIRKNLEEIWLSYLKI